MTSGPERAYRRKRSPSSRSQEIAREPAENGAVRFFFRREAPPCPHDVRDQHGADDALEHVLLRVPEPECFDADRQRCHRLDDLFVEWRKNRFELVDPIRISNTPEDELERVE